MSTERARAAADIAHEFVERNWGWTLDHRFDEDIAKLVANAVSQAVKERDYWKQQYADQMIRPCPVAHHEDQEIQVERQAEEIARLQQEGQRILLEWSKVVADKEEEIARQKDEIEHLLASVDLHIVETARLRADLTQEMAGHEETVRASNAYHEKREQQWAERVQAAVEAELELLITRVLDWAARCKTGPVTKHTYVDTGQLWRTHGWNDAMDYVIKRLPEALRAHGDK